MPNIDITYIKTRVGEDELARLTDHSGGAISNTQITACITDATAVVDTVLFQKYGEPLVFASGDSGDRAKEYIRRIKFDIALYYLYNKKHDDEEMKDVYVRYNKAFSQLEKIRKGDINIIGLTSNNTQSSIIEVSTVEDDRIFTKERMGWIIS